MDPHGSKLTARLDLLPRNVDLLGIEEGGARLAYHGMSEALLRGVTSLSADVHPFTTRLQVVLAASFC
jgi:hypothetical protein